MEQHFRSSPWANKFFLKAVQFRPGRNSARWRAGPVRSPPPPPNQPARPRHVYRQPTSSSVKSVQATLVGAESIQPLFFKLQAPAAIDEQRHHRMRDYAKTSSAMPWKMIDQDRVSVGRRKIHLPGDPDSVCEGLDEIASALEQPWPAPAAAPR